VGGVYVFHAGYWGPHVGFYGGVNYGFGYVGVGYGGGFWRGGVFSYNRTVNNFGSVNITNVYNKTVVVNNVSKVSYNGGTGGLTAKANQRELSAATERHVAATGTQTQHQQMASTNRDLKRSVNGGHPAIAATSQAGRFQGAGVVAAHPAGSAGQNSTGGAGAHSPAGALNTGPTHTGTNTSKPTNATTLSHTPSGSGTTQRLPGATNLQSGAQTGTHASTAAVGSGTQRPGNVTSSTHTGGPPGGFRPPGGGKPPVVANTARPASAAVMRGPPPRGPAPKGPPPKGQHH
jgi:hypothetical protein